MIRTEFIMAMVFCFLAIWGCGRSEATDTKQPEQTRPQPVQSIELKKISAVVRIVFVGQKEACNCTRDRIDGSWSILQDTLKEWKTIAIERIQLDVDEKRYKELGNTKPLMVAPGLYFYDANNKLLDMLQGETEAYQILNVLMKAK